MGLLVNGPSAALSRPTRYRIVVLTIQSLTPQQLKETLLFAEKYVEVLPMRGTRIICTWRSMTLSEKDERSQVLVDRLLMIINTQPERAKLGLDLPGVLSLLVRRAQELTTADGALIKLAEGHDRVAEESELFLRATHDALTGLANRALFDDRLRQCIAQASRSGQRVGVLLIDIDGLQEINDKRGQRVGDEAIKESGRRISSVLRQSDTAARLGGDKFGVILSRVNDRGGPVKFAERLFDRINKPFRFEGRRVPLGASVGFSLYPEDGEEMEKLVAKANESMDSEKNSKKVVPPPPKSEPTHPLISA